ncbi:MAG: class I tRNA ligase family protein, partial [Nitrososphaerota archaeon]
MTAALPYSYAPRHFGHLAGAYLPADIFARFRRLVGDQTVFVCGTDENASSIVLEAIKQNMTPKELCDKYYPIQKEVFERLGISFDIFSRTSKPIHYEVVREFYKKLWDKGYIYPKEIKQWWCPKDRMVLPDRFVKGTCPRCGAEDQYGDVCEVCGSWYESFELLNPKCTLCGGKPEIIGKTHFFLKLSELTSRVLEYVRDKKHWRKATYNKTISWLEKEGLRDKDITRDYEWGPPAPFPNAENQVIY